MRAQNESPVGIVRYLVGVRPGETATAVETRRGGTRAGARRWGFSSRPDRLNGTPDLRRALLQAVEKTRATLTSYRESPALAAAARVFDEELAPEEQLAIAEEVVLTRSVELARAYPNTVAISFGPRRRRGESGLGHCPAAPPCVRFLVGAKWPPSARRILRKGTIPRRLLAMATVGGRRVLCAVPTDVEDARYTTF